MSRHSLPVFPIDSLPEFQRLAAVNPGQSFEAKQLAVIYARAIDWYAILKTIWPDFTKGEYHSIEVGYLFIQDPDEGAYPDELYKSLAITIAMFWDLQLSELFPEHNWRIEVRDDPEFTVEARILTRLP